MTTETCPHAASRTERDPRIPSYDVDFFSDEMIENQEAHLKTMRGLGPVLWLPKNGNYAVTRYVEICEGLRNWKVFSSALGVAGDDFGCQFSRGGTLTSDPPLHDKLRSVSVAPLRPAKMDGYRAAIQAEATALIDRLLERSSFDGVADLARHLPVTMVTELVGLPEEGRENMLDWADAGFNISGCQNARGKAALETAKGMRAWIDENAVPEKMKPGSWSFQLTELAAQGKIPQEYVIAIMRDYIGPSLDTTISATGQMLYFFGQNPDQWDKVRNDPSLINSAVTEAIRLASPVRSFTRTTTQETVLGGVNIPKGARVMMLYGSGNRDERQFPNPEAFDVTRDDGPHLSFGQGSHICEGMHLAQLEMRSLLRAMVSRVERIEVGRPEIVYNNSIKGFASLPVTFKAAAKADKITRPAAINGGWIDAFVVSQTKAATDIVTLTLAAEDGGVLPAYDAGAHIDVKMGEGLIRQYSLCSLPDDQGQYRLGVLRDPRSRGGSTHVHDTLKAGSRVRISEPRNLFPLNADSGHSILLAGGIGVTPIMAMAYDLKTQERTFEMHYTARELSRAAFVPEMQSAFGDHLTVYADDEQGASRLDVPHVLAAAKTSDHIYCCGPSGFIDYVVAQAKAAGWPDSHVHVERFSGGDVDTAGAFQLVAQKSGLTIDVPEGTTILQALLDAGIETPYSCETGVCGTCVCKVVEGTPEHQDSYLTDEQKTSNNKIAICCSRSKSERLVLDI